MYLSRFGVKNYKCLGEIDIPLTPIHVLIGENDAGKTSLLEAMTALHSSSQDLLPQAFPRPWSGLELVRHNSRETRVHLSGQWSTRSGETPPTAYPSLKYDLQVEFPQSGTNCVVAEETLQLGSQPPSVMGQGTRRDKTELLIWGQTGQVSPDADVAELEVLSEVLKPAHKYAFDSSMMALPAAIDKHRRFRLDPDGFGLATLLDDVVTYQPELFIQLRDRFCELLPQFRSVRVVTEHALKRSWTSSGRYESGAADGKGIRFETRSGCLVRGEQASGGAVLLLGFLALAHLPNPPALLLVEEPETGVYPKRLGQVIKILKQMVHREEGPRFPQIILTTHSPFVLSFFEPEEVTFLSRRKDGPDAPVRARPLRDAPKIKERMGSEFYLGEIWYNLTEEDLFGEP